MSEKANASTDSTLPGTFAWALALTVLLFTVLWASSSKDRASRDASVERLRAAATERAADAQLIRSIRALLPGERVPEHLLRRVGPDAVFPVLEHWRGQLDDWRVDALQTTNDSQVACQPWGSMTALSFLTSRNDGLAGRAGVADAPDGSAPAWTK